MSNSHWDDISVKVDDSCPIATRDIGVNLKNRQNAIDTAGYGPLNPTKPNNEFWDAKAERWNVTADDARGQKCGNCAAFIKTKKMLGCIDEGLGNESGNAAWDVINAGDLGYCEAFDFKCASSRTCDAWIVGGPITEEKENNMEEKSLEDMYSELLAIEEKSMEDTYLELLAIEEKTSSMVVPNRRGSSLNPSKRDRTPVYDEGEEEDESEDDMLYDEDYVGDDEDDKAMMKPTGSGSNPGSPRDASDRQRGQQFMNWASGRSPSGNNVHPTSVGNMDIGDSGRRSVATDRMNNLMRNRSWTNPRPRPGVGSRATAINTGPPARPKIIGWAPLPTQGFSPKKERPKDWGSDNNAQLISGATSGFNNDAKSAWDEEAYYEYEYDFDMKKLPVGDSSPPKRPVRGPGNPGAPKPTTRSSGPSPDARSGAANASWEKFGSWIRGEDAKSPARTGVAERRAAGLKKYIGDVAIGSAGSASGSPVGDNRGRTRPVRGPGNPGAPKVRPIRGIGNPGPKPRPTRGSGNPGPKVNQQRGLAAAGDYFSGRSGDPRANAQQQAARGRGRVSNFGEDVIGDGSSLPGADRRGPQPKPGKANRATPRIDRSDPPRQRPLSLFQAVPRQNKPSQGFGNFGKPKTWSGSPGAGGPRERINPSVRSFAGKSYDQGYDEYDEYQNYLYQKSYDQGYDEYDEYIDFKGMTDEQAAGLRAAGNFYSGRNVGGSTLGSADATGSRGKVRRSATFQNFGSQGPKVNKPNTWSSRGSADTAAARIGGFTGGSRFQYRKASDEEMYYDDEDDEIATPPDEDAKADSWEKFGSWIRGEDAGQGDQAKLSASRESQLRGWAGALGTAQTHGGSGSPPKRPIRDAQPRTPRPTPVGGGRGLNPGNPGPNKRPNTTLPYRPGNRAPGGASPYLSNKPNRPASGSPGAGGPRRNPPAKPASSTSSGGGGDRSVVQKFIRVPTGVLRAFSPWQ